MGGGGRGELPLPPHPEPLPRSPRARGTAVPQAWGGANRGTPPPSGVRRSDSPRPGGAPAVAQLSQRAGIGGGGREEGVKLLFVTIPRGGGGSGGESGGGGGGRRRQGWANRRGRGRGGVLARPAPPRLGRAPPSAPHGPAAGPFRPPPAPSALRFPAPAGPSRGPPAPSAPLRSLPSRPVPSPPPPGSVSLRPSHPSLRSFRSFCTPPSHAALPPPPSLASLTSPPAEEVGCEPRAPGDTPETKSESGGRCLPPRRAAALCPGLTSRAQIPAFPCRQICPCKGWGRGWGGSSRHLGGGGTAMPLRPRPCEHRSPAPKLGGRPWGVRTPSPSPGHRSQRSASPGGVLCCGFVALFLTCFILFFPSQEKRTEVDDARGYKGSVACS